MLAVVAAYPLGVFDSRSPVHTAAPPAEIPAGPVPSATPIVVMPKPVEPPAPLPSPKRVRLPAKKKAAAPEAKAAAEPVPPTNPLAEKLARVRAAPTSDLRFELADEVEAAADRTLDREAAAGVKACLTQFRITGGVDHLEGCLEKFETARRSVMTPSR